MPDSPTAIPRVAPKAYDYTREILDFGFHNAQSVGMTARLERDFAERFGHRHGIAHCNGTATMQSALAAAGVGAGDEVIVPSFTVFSTPAVALHCNAVPVIVDVDPDFQSSEEWYQSMARSKPPKDKPWYHVLVHGADHITYVAERNLEADESAKPVKHPALDHFFKTFENGHYLFHQRAN